MNDVEILFHTKQDINYIDLLHVVVYKSHKYQETSLIASLVDYPVEGYNNFDDIDICLNKDNNIYLKSWRSYNSCD